MRLYAFSGDGAARTAAAVAKFLGREARKDRLYVLAVDACGGELAEALCVADAFADDDGPTPPDAFLERGTADPEGLGAHIARSSLSALRVIQAPRNPSLRAAPLQEAGREIFDLCVVACGDADSPYAEDWLHAADEVVGCSVEDARKALEAALLAEEKRDRNGTMLAVAGGGSAGSSAGAAPPEAGARPLYSLGPSAASGTRADKGLRDLTRALVSSGSTIKEEANA